MFMNTVIKNELLKQTRVISRGGLPTSSLPTLSFKSFFSTNDGNEPESNDEKKKSQSKSEVLHSLANMSDEDIVAAVNAGKISQYKLEKELKQSLESGGDPDCHRAVRIRRKWLEGKIKADFDSDNKAFPTKSPLDIDDDDSGALATSLPFGKFDFHNFYQQVLGKNCENVIGYVPIPVGFVGPLKMNGRDYNIPLATTEGALLASTNRGCRAITLSGGASSFVFNDGMTRAPVLLLPSAERACAMKEWIEAPENFEKIKAGFESTTNFGKLQNIKCSIAGRHIFLRFICTTGDAMGMNMISKGCMEALSIIREPFPDYELLAVSGNVCTDKKPSAVNWIEGRGKSVTAEIVLSSKVIVDVLKCTVQSLVQLNTAKNLVGSAVAGSLGGNNAHASNVVTALFLATGQDPAQNVESSNCMTLMEAVNDGNDLHVSVTLPVVEVGTVGGGTGLTAQKACLEMLGVAGANFENPGDNARELAKVVAGAVLAGEISLMSALASNHLVSAHMKLNR
jgi:hydroxymethylglutaryl-CoA reductase (NADPH)